LGSVVYKQKFNHSQIWMPTDVKGQQWIRSTHPVVQNKAEGSLLQHEEEDASTPVGMTIRSTS
jgi:hypothetical protein